MTAIVGGLRARLIRDSIYHCLYDSLESLGWFEDGRRHRPIIFTGDTTPNDEKIEFNTIALSDEDMTELDMEMGSTLVENTWTYYVDFFAENDAIGKHLIYDIKDILGGRMSSISRDHARIPVYNYMENTPSLLFNVDVEEIVVDRAHDFPKPWQKHWYSCRFVVVDYYSDDTETTTEADTGAYAGGYAGGY